MQNNFNIYMIVYEKNEKRVNNYLSQKEKLCDLQKFSAIDSINDHNNSIKLNDNKLNDNKIVNDKLKGKLGCNLSHQLLWLKHLESENNWVLIVEDDTDINLKNLHDFYKEINNLINIADTNNSHFIQLEIRSHHLVDQLKQDKLNLKNLYKMKPQCGTSAYLISKQGVNLCFESLPWNEYIDVVINTATKIDELNALCYKNDIFKTIGASRQVDKRSQLGSIIYNMKAN